jgi:hypothetical protein
MSDKPAAIRNSNTPYTSPFRSWATNNSIDASDGFAARRS